MGGYQPIKIPVEQLSTSSASTLGTAGKLLSSRGSQTRQKAIGKGKRQWEVPNIATRTLSVQEREQVSVFMIQRKCSACPSHCALGPVPGRPVRGFLKQGLLVSSWKCCFRYLGLSPMFLRLLKQNTRRESGWA